MYLDTLQKHTETLGNILLLVLCHLAPRESDNLLTKCGNLLSLPRYSKAQLDGKEVLANAEWFLHTAHMDMCCARDRAKNIKLAHAK